MRSTYLTATLLSSSLLIALAGCGGSDAHTGDAESDIQASSAGDIALAMPLPAQCQGAEIFRVTRPIATDGSTSGKFSYGFRFKPPTTPGAPVVVYLPGGPGSASTEKPPAFIPEGWGYLLTDPRGVGCNTPLAIPPANVSAAFFRTDEIARDVVAAIADRHLDNYVLYGLSYGTLLGTTVAHDLESAPGVTRPRAVVLEGVLGRAFKSDEFAGDEFITQWNRVRSALPQDVLTELDTKPAPFGIDASGWSHILPALLPASPRVAFDHVVALSQQLGLPEGTQANEVATLKSIADEASHEHTEPGAIELYREVACREIVDTTPAGDLDIVFASGKLVRNRAEEGTKCAGLHVTAPYDSANLQFSSKLYYFIGENDVATPSWQGAYHFEHHRGPAVRVISEKAGHNSLQFNQAACAGKVMTSIAAGGADLAQVLATCPSPVHVDSK